MHTKISEGTLNLFITGYPPYQVKFKCNIDFLIEYHRTLLSDHLIFQ